MSKITNDVLTGWCDKLRLLQYVINKYVTSVPIHYVDVCQYHSITIWRVFHNALTIASCSLQIKLLSSCSSVAIYVAIFSYRSINLLCSPVFTHSQALSTKRIKCTKFCIGRKLPGWADNGSHFVTPLNHVTHHSADRYDPWPMTQSQTMALVDHYYPPICNNIIN